MPRRTRVTDTVFARGVSHLAEYINAIEEKHRIMPADLVRGLLEAAVEFYRVHGWFSFPVRIEPEAFQRDYIAAEREQERYDAGPKKAAKPPDKPGRSRGTGPTDRFSKSA